MQKSEGRATSAFYRLACGLALLAFAGAYANHFHNSFHFDDSHTILNNVYIRNFSNIPLFFRSPAARMRPKGGGPGCPELSRLDKNMLFFAQIACRRRDDGSAVEQNFSAGADGLANIFFADECGGAISRSRHDLAWHRRGLDRRQSARREELIDSTA